MCTIPTTTILLRTSRVGTLIAEDPGGGGRNIIRIDGDVRVVTTSVADSVLTCLAFLHC